MTIIFWPSTCNRVISLELVAREADSKIGANLICIPQDCEKMKNERVFLSFGVYERRVELYIF